MAFAAAESRYRPPSELTAELGTILSIWAHPDDETYLAGGIMALAAANRQRVVCVSATYGEHGTDDPGTWPPERLRRIRRWESAAAMAVLGVTEHRWLDYPDGSLAGLDPGPPVARIQQLLAEIRPDTILTFGPDGTTFHPDHQTVSAWVGEAWRQAGRPGRLLHSAVTDEHLQEWGDRYERWGIYMTDERPVGVPADRLALDVALPESVLDQKVAALCAMHTQTSPAVATLGQLEFRALNSTETFVAVDGSDQLGATNSRPSSRTTSASGYS
jgi:LmbE family N-acetylglucosaminyl deacetylase